MSLSKPPSQTKTTSLTSPLQKSSASWQEHPLVIATGTAVATFTFCILIGKEAILPTLTASLNNQLTNLQHIKSQKIQSDQKVVSLERQLAESDRKLQIAQNANLFPLGSPYPTGLSKIRVGDSVTDVSKEFVDGAIDQKNEYCIESEGCISVKINHGIINAITYFFDEKSKNKIITHISYHLGYSKKFSDSFLQEKLIEALGNPTSNPRKSFYSWKTSSNVIVYKSAPGSIIVMSEDWIPGDWPQPHE
jgi:hypothetical protein